MRFLFSPEGEFLRELILEEVSAGLDAVSRSTLLALIAQIQAESNNISIILFSWFPPVWTSVFKERANLLIPPLSPEDERLIKSTSKLVLFLLGDLNSLGESRRLHDAPGYAHTMRILMPTLIEFSPRMRQFGVQITERLIKKLGHRALIATV